VEVVRSMAKECCPAMDAERLAEVQIAVQDTRFKFIWSSSGQHEFYDLEKDPGETTSLFAAIPAGPARAAYDRLQLAVGDVKPRPAEQLKPQDIERLRALGYLQDDEKKLR